MLDKFLERMLGAVIPIILILAAVLIVYATFKTALSLETANASTLMSYQAREVAILQLNNNTNRSITHFSDNN